MKVMSEVCRSSRTEEPEDTLKTQSGMSVSAAWHWYARRLWTLTGNSNGKSSWMFTLVDKYIHVLHRESIPFSAWNSLPCSTPCSYGLAHFCSSLSCQLQHHFLQEAFCDLPNRAGYHPSTPQYLTRTTLVEHQGPWACLSISLTSFYGP